ncbi:MAG: flavin reductase family protein [Natrialbaceae archaeon]|nr:flavin reductase family protein [Natrialbaceae archaeon]
MADSDAFRHVTGTFATGVTVTTLPGDPPHGLTANAFTSVSLEPPLVLVCLDHETESHERFTNNEADGYCVNVLAADQQHLGEHFASITELEESPFEAEPTTTAVTGAPIFEESLAYLDCSLHDSLRAGDHTIYVGEVEEMGVLDAKSPALTFFRGEWGELE